MDVEWLADASEGDLRAFLHKHLYLYFELFPEVDGVFPVDGSEVRIDYMLRPRTPLVAMGFDWAWFGVEVKAVGAIGKRASKGVAAAWQSVTYGLSTFVVDGENVRPDFVLMFPAFNCFLAGREGAQHHSRVTDLLQHANVGSLDFNGNEWAIRFSSQTLFSLRRGPGRVKNLGTKRKVGNVSTRREN